jgi:hypothetical protein
VKRGLLETILPPPNSDRFEERLCRFDEESCSLCLFDAAWIGDGEEVRYEVGIRRVRLVLDG